MNYAIVTQVEAHFPGVVHPRAIGVGSLRAPMTADELKLLVDRRDEIISELQKNSILCFSDEDGLDDYAPILQAETRMLSELDEVETQMFLEMLLRFETTAFGAEEARGRWNKRILRFIEYRDAVEPFLQELQEHFALGGGSPETG